MKTIQMASRPFRGSEERPARTASVHVHPEALDPTASLHGWYVPLKAVVDWIAAAVLMVLAIPIIFVCAAAVALTSRGPAFYCQRRVGKGGREFTLIKLRTMCVDAESATGPVWSAAADPRVTPVGRFLRDTHLDELPQLINVLLGHMSLVGPRPERPVFVVRLIEEIPFYEERIKVRPGITGLSQMRLPPDTDLESVRKKLMHDLYYVKHASPWLDLKILGYTFSELLYSMAASLCAFFMLPAREIVEKDFHWLVHQDFGTTLFEEDDGEDLYQSPAEQDTRPLAKITPDRVQAPISRRVESVDCR